MSSSRVAAAEGKAHASDLRTPPSTPRQCRQAPTPTSPPRLAKQPPKPPLLRSLESNCELEVTRALLQNPDAASQPFWDQGVEPPLCAAVRLRCKERIVELLVEHGADASAINVLGHTPLAMLSTGVPPVPWGGMTEQSEVTVATILLQAGDDESSLGALARLARGAGKDHLARLFLRLGE